MRIGHRTRAAGILGAAAWFALTAHASAQMGPGAPMGGPGGQNRPGLPYGQRTAPRNYLPEMKSVVEDAAKRYQAKIVLDPSAFVAAAPKAVTDARTIDEAMGELAKQIRGGSWRKVYLNQVQANVTPAPEKLVEAVRALDRIEASGIVLENPATKRATAYMKNYPISDTFKDDLAAQQFSTTPVYVLYGGTTDTSGKPDIDRFLDLQRQQLDMMLRMDPETMAQAMQQGLNMFMSADPQTRQQLMSTMMRSGMQMFMNMPPEQRNALIQEAMRNAQGVFGGGGPGGPGGRPGGPMR